MHVYGPSNMAYLYIYIRYMNNITFDISSKDIVEDYESKDHKYKVHKEIHYGPNGKTVFQSSSSIMGSPMIGNGKFGSPFKFPSVFDTPDRMGDIEGKILTRSYNFI